MSSASKAIVIGSGFGGLAAAVRLRAKGYEVQVFEGSDQLGGRASVFKRDGFTFDAGPTVMTAPYLVSELFELFGRDTRDYFEMVPVDPFYRIVYPDGSEFDYVGDEERLLENIRKLSPQDVEGYRKLEKKAKEIFKIGYEDLSDQPFLKITDMLKVIPDMIRLGNHRSVYSMVSKYIKDDRLRQAFSFEPLLVGGNPFSITSIYLLIHWLERKWGVHFVKGGTTALVNAFHKLLAEQGVEFHLSNAVERIEVVNGRASGVQAQDGRFYPADLIVSNADPILVYSKMIDPKYRKANTDRRVLNMHSSMGLFVIYFGAKKTYPNLAHHTILLGPRYKGLLQDIFQKKILAQDFSLYLHAPTRTDASMAPPGCEAFYVLSPVPNLDGKIDWSEMGPIYKNRILDWLDQNYLPELRENLVSESFVTPEYFRDQLRSYRGAGFGIEPRLTQSAYFRFHNRSQDVNNLYFVGASTHPGAGVPGVLSSAKVLERLVPRADFAQDIVRRSSAVQSTAKSNFEKPLEL